MQHRTLGRSRLEVSAIGLGLMSMSGVYGKGDDAESIAVIHHALDGGFNFLDSSDMNGWGQNKELLGRAIRARPDQAVLVPKFGRGKNPAGGANLVNGRPRTVKQASDPSFRR